MKMKYETQTTLNELTIWGGGIYSIGIGTCLLIYN